MPKIEVYNAPVEQLDQSLRTYFQWPRYRELTIEFGGSLSFPHSHKITPKKIGAESYLMIQLDGEREARAFDLSAMPIIPFTLQINNHHIRSLVTVEQMTESGVKLRTFGSLE